MSRLIAATLGCLLVASTVALSAPAEAATTATLKFGTFYPDQPGADTPVTTAKLNREYIQVKNTSRTAQVLTGYVIRDAKNKHTYTFPKGFKLAAGRTVTVHTGPGRNTASDLYWGNTRSMVWNNTGDTARLIKGSKVVATCTYKPTAAQLRAKAGFRSC